MSDIDPVPQLEAVLSKVPSLIFVESTSQYIAGSWSFNEAGYSFNEAGVEFGGLYGNDNAPPQWR